MDELRQEPGGRVPTIDGQPPTLPGTFQPCAFAPRCPRATDVCRAVEPRYAWPADDGFACHHPLGGGSAVGTVGTVDAADAAAHAADTAGTTADAAGTAADAAGSAADAPGSAADAPGSAADAPGSAAGTGP